MAKPPAPPAFDAVLYDLDGTLLDTLADLADAANHALRRLGFPAHPEAAYRYFVGDGVRTLMQRGLPEPRRAEADRVEQAVAAMAEAYAERWHVRTQPYPGIPALVEACSAAGLPQVVLSNKPDPFTTQITAYFFPAHPFAHVQGQRPGIPCKPDPSAALSMARRLAVAPERVLYLGDTSTDMRTAVAAGMYPVGACWGFRPREELAAHGARRLADHPADVAQILKLPSKR